MTTRHVPRQFLGSLGCDQYQGFHFSPPLPALEFAELLRARSRPEDAGSLTDSERTHSKLAGRR